MKLPEEVNSLEAIEALRNSAFVSAVAEIQGRPEEKGPRQINYRFVELMNVLHATACRQLTSVRERDGIRLHEDVIVELQHDLQTMIDDDLNVPELCGAWLDRLQLLLDTERGPS